MMLLFLGLIICIFFNAGNGVVIVSPSGNPVYFSVGTPATIICTAQVDSGNVEDSIFAVQLVKTSDAQAPLNCVASRSRGSLEYIFSPLLGNVSLSRSFPQQSTITCSYTLPAIQDGNYTCSALRTQPPTETQSITVMTTKQLDGLYVNNGSSVVAAKEGDSINISCVATNSKPGYSMSWSSSFNGEIIPTSESTVNGYTNSTTFLTVVTSSNMNGQTLTCSASSPIQALGSRSVTVTFNIFYGPTDMERTLTTGNRTFICPLDSNPQIEEYTWHLDNITIGCSKKLCEVTLQEVQTGSQITCQGQNPETKKVAKSTINFVWSTTSTSSTAASDSSKSGDSTQSDLSAGEIAGIVIGVVAFIVLVIVIPIAVCMKRKRVKGASAGSEINANRRSTTPASSGQQSSRPYNFENTPGGGYKSPLSIQPDVVRNSGFSPSTSEPGQPHKAPSTPPPAYPGAMDMIDQKPRSRKPIALYDTALDDAYPNQTNASYVPSPKY